MHGLISTIEAVAHFVVYSSVLSELKKIKRDFAFDQEGHALIKQFILNTITPAIEENWERDFASQTVADRLRLITLLDAAVVCRYHVSVICISAIQCLTKSG
jgi:hypothetical protein